MFFLWTTVHLLGLAECYHINPFLFTCVKHKDFKIVLWTEFKVVIAEIADASRRDLDEFIFGEKMSSYFKMMLLFHCQNTGKFLCILPVYCKKLLNIHESKHHWFFKEITLNTFFKCVKHKPVETMLWVEKLRCIRKIHERWSQRVKWSDCLGTKCHDNLKRRDVRIRIVRIRSIFFFF